jgi:transposase
MTTIEQLFREEGRKQAQMKIAKAALREGSSVEFVADITGLPRETVLRLKSEVEQEGLAGSSQGSHPEDLKL